MDELITANNSHWELVTDGCGCCSSRKSYPKDPDDEYMDLITLEDLQDHEERLKEQLEFVAKLRATLEAESSPQAQPKA